MRLLIIDDDVVLANSLQTSLKQSYAIDLSFNAEMGEYLATTNDYDAIIIDFNLPDKTGVELCVHLRNDGCRVPILMLTGRSEINDKVYALDSGVDDYLIKPFSTKELQARIRALFRRQPMLNSKNILTHGEISMDLNLRTVKKNNQLIQLRRKEFQILEFLLRNRGQVVRREVLLEHVWSGDHEPNTNSIDVHIKQLRKKLKQDALESSSSFIESIYGFGYQIK